MDRVALADSLTFMRMGQLMGLAVLAGCYAPQSLNVAASVADWQANQRAAESTDAPSADPTEWTAEALVKRAMAANPDQLAWGARATAATAAIDAAGGFADIELRVTEGKVEQIKEGEPEFELALRGRPPRPGMIGSRVDAARMRAEEVGARRDSSARRLRAWVRQLHAEMVLLARERDVARAEEALRSQRRALVTDQLAQQAASQLDVALAELDRAEVADQVSELTVQYEQAAARLKALIDWPMNRELRVTGDPGGIDQAAEPITADSSAQWVDAGLATRSEVRETAASLARSRADLYRAQSERWPWLGYVQLSYDAHQDSQPTDWGFALSVDLPIFAWTGADVGAQEAVTRQRKVEHRGAMTTVARQVESAHREVLRARERLDAVRDGLLPAAQEAAKIAEQAEATQALDALRAVRLKVSRLRAQRRQLDALRAWVAARIRLDETAER